jgi:hypothetical protein
LDGFLKITRRQQVNMPVNARIAGTSPKSVHAASANQPNRPKCNRCKPVVAFVGKTVSGIEKK